MHQKYKKKKKTAESLEVLVDAFIEHLVQIHRAKGTIKGRRERLRHFLVFCRSKEIQEAHQVTEKLIREYMDSFDPGQACSTKSGRLTVLRIFFQYLLQNDAVLFSPVTMEIVGPQQHTPRSVLSVFEAERILSLPDTETPIGIRDRAILETLYSTGMRRSELCALRLADLDLEGRTIFIHEGKGRRDRLVPVGERAVLWLKRYLAEARSLILAWPDCGYVFLNREGGRLMVHSAGEMVREYINRSGLEKIGACHIFRHTAATRMLENGADIRYIQELLGHESINTTTIYTRLSVRQLRETHRRSHPAPAYEPDAVEFGHKKPRRIVYRTPFVDTKKQKKKHSDALALVLDEYLADREFSGLAALSIRSARVGVERLLAFCRTKRILSVNKITTAVLTDFQKSLVEYRKKNGEPLLINTQYSILKEVRLFCRYLKRAGYLLYDPSEKLTLPEKTRRLPAEYLSAEEAERVLSLADVSLPYGLRDRLVMELLYSTGMRRSELLGLLVSDFDLENRTVFVRATKQGRDRTLPLGERLMGHLERYLTQVRPQFVQGEDPGNLWLVSNGKLMVIDYISQICRTYLKKAGLGHKGSAHAFRHTMATLMLENGADVRTVQEMLGHSRLTTTQIYTHVSIRKLREVHDRTHPAEILLRERRERRTQEG